MCTKEIKFYYVLLSNGTVLLEHVFLSDVLSDGKHAIKKKIRL